jgi:hypothetical protein
MKTMFIATTFLQAFKKRRGEGTKRIGWVSGKKLAKASIEPG